MLHLLGAPLLEFNFIKKKKNSTIFQILLNQEELPSSWLVSEELLLLLHDTLLVLPDNMAPQVLRHVLTAEILLILANHCIARVRTAVVKVIYFIFHLSK